LFALAWFVAALVMAAVLFAGHRRGLVTLAQLARWLPISFAASFALWFAGHWDTIWSTREVHWHYETLPYHAVLALFLALPVATIPQTMRWARHR
jgi:hypothetical protein